MVIVKQVYQYWSHPLMCPGNCSCKQGYHLQISNMSIIPGSLCHGTDPERKKSIK